MAVSLVPCEPTGSGFSTPGSIPVRSRFCPRFQISLHLTLPLSPLIALLRRGLFDEGDGLRNGRMRSTRQRFAPQNRDHQDRLPLRKSWQNTYVQVRVCSQVHRLMSPYLNAHVRQDLFSCLLPLYYRNTPIQAHPARYRLLRFLVFLLRYMLLGLLSLVNRTSLNQRALGLTTNTLFLREQAAPFSRSPQFNCRIT